MPVVLALSVSGLVERIGAYAGLAAILGLAVLALLYFSQARELRRLRAWAGDRPEREPGSGEAAPPARPAVAPTQAPGSRVVAQPRSGAPGAAPPGPPGAAPAIARPAVVGADAPVAAPPAAPSSAFSPARRAAPSAPSGLSFGDAPPDSAPPPASSASATATAPGATQAPARPPVAGSETNGSSPMSSASGAARLAPAPPTEEGHRRRWIGPSAAAAGLVAVAAIVLAIVLGSSSPAPRSAISAGAGAAGTHQPARGAAPGHRPLTVTVLNGTTISGLALSAAQQLVHAGFRQSGVGNATDRTRSATIVSFSPGYRRDADRVAAVLRVSDIRPMDPQTLDVARRIPGANPNVVVTVGADRSSNP